MLAYIIKRLLLILPTLFGIMLISFVIIQFAPGGPVERMIAQLTGSDACIEPSHPLIRTASTASTRHAN